MDKMTTVTITISTENAAFEEQNGCLEVARILRNLADEFEQTDAPVSGRLRDYNGNTCGRVEIDD